MVYAFSFLTRAYPISHCDSIWTSSNPTVSSCLADHSNRQSIAGEEAVGWYPPACFKVSGIMTRLVHGLPREML